MKLGAGWRACGVLSCLWVGSCNTFDEPGGSDGSFDVPDGPLVPPRAPGRPPTTFPIVPPVPPLPGVAGMFSPLPPAAGSPWQPIDSGVIDADGGEEDAGE